MAIGSDMWDAKDEGARGTGGAQEEGAFSVPTTTAASLLLLL